MINLEKKIKLILVKNKISLKEFCEKIEMTEQNLYSLFKSNDIKLSHLNKISIFFKIPLSYFDDVEDLDSVLPVVSISESEKDKKIKQLRHKVKKLEKDNELFKSLLSKS